MSAQRSNNMEVFKTIMQTVVIGGAYIVISAGLISFNKHLMHPGKFPHATHLTSIHMTVTSVMALSLYAVAPQLFPSMQKASSDIRSVMKYILPLGACFAVALYCSNSAYLYCTVAFLQFCKEGNVPLIFAVSCILGLQIFSWRKVAVLSIVVAGCTMCVHGELKFSAYGFVLQITSQVAEVSKNLIGEMVMSSAGLKLDVLTFVAFQAPCSLMPLLVAAAATWTPEVTEDLYRMWPLLLANALLAFALNVMIALTLKKLSTVAFVIIGVVKDIMIVSCSAVVFGDAISSAQQVGFTVTIVGVLLWGHLKIKEQEEESLAKESVQEREHLLKQQKTESEAA